MEFKPPLTKASSISSLPFTLQSGKNPGSRGTSLTKFNWSYFSDSVKDLRFEDNDMDKDFRLNDKDKWSEDKDLWSGSRTWTRICKLVLEDKDFPQGQQHCLICTWNYRLCLHLNVCVSLFFATHSTTRCIHRLTHSLIAALDQLTVAASSTSNDLGIQPFSRLTPRISRHGMGRTIGSYGRMAVELWQCDTMSHCRQYSVILLLQY